MLSGCRYFAVLVITTLVAATSVAQNLLENPRFYEDFDLPLRGWTVLDGAASWDSEDSDAKGNIDESGSALISSVGPADTIVEVLYQCETVDEGVTYEFGASILIPAEEDASVRGLLVNSFYATPDCTSDWIVQTLSPSPAVFGQWTEVEVTGTAPPGANSVRVALAVGADGVYAGPVSAKFDDVFLYPSQTTGWISPPSDTQVRNADGSNILFDCADVVKPSLPPDEDLQLAWLEALGYYGEPVVGYHHQVFRGTSCLGTPIDEAWWIELLPPRSGSELSDYYYVELGEPAGGSYCWRVRGVDSEFGGVKAYAEDYDVSNWTDCCCFEVSCNSTARPNITAVADTTCGGSTEDTTPTIVWTNYPYDDGYRWEVRNSAGAVVDSGTAERDRASDTVKELAPGTYAVRAQTIGDGLVYCDSVWGAMCSFTIEDTGIPDDGLVDFEWWPDQPKQGQQVRFADLSGGTPASWFWDFGDGWTSNQQHPSHVFDTAGAYTVARDVELETGHVIEQKTITVAGSVECGDTMCEGLETAWSCPADCALPPDQTGRAGGSDLRPTVPAAAGGLRGANGTEWYTEGWVHNPGEEPARFILEYTARGKTSILQAGPFDLGPGLTIYWDNIVEDLFHSTGSGALWVDSTAPVIFLTRTYTVDPGKASKSSGGTFGAAHTATRERLTVGRDEGKLYLIGLREDGKSRSNLHFQSIDENREITVRVEVFDNTGILLSRDTFSIGGHSPRQKGLGQHFGISGVASAYAALEVIEGEGRLNAWGSVIDNITGDFIFTDAIHSSQVAGKSGSEQHFLVAAVAHTTGVFRSVWRSGLDIFNEPSSASQTVTLRFEPEYDRTGVVGDSLERMVTIQSGEQLSWDDVLVELFDIPENAKTQGALHLFSQDSLTINSHTHNERSDGGSLGMGLPGLKSGDLISADGKAGIMPGLSNSGGTRTNIGLAEYSGQDTLVRIDFYTTDQENFFLNRNEPVGGTVPANVHMQLLNIFEQVESLRDIELKNVKAEVWVEGGGSIYSYATTIDNKSGDPTAFTAATD